jgi:tetratricopeptide (TPR) repeat protein
MRINAWITTCFWAIVLLALTGTPLPAQEMELCGIRLNTPITDVRIKYGEPDQELELQNRQKALLYKLFDEGAVIFTYQDDLMRMVSAIQISGDGFSPSEQLTSIRIGDPVERIQEVLGMAVSVQDVPKMGTKYHTFPHNVSIESKNDRVFSVRITWNEFAQLKQQVKEFAETTSQPEHQAQMAAAARYAGAGRHNQALILYTDLQQQYPGTIDLVIPIGRTLQAMHKPQEALVVYDKALELAPKHPGVMVFRASVLYELERIREAMDTLEEVIAQDVKGSGPGSAYDAWVRLGNMYESEEFPEKSLHAYETAYTLAPDQALPLLDKALSLEKSQKIVEALAIVQEVEKQIPDNQAVIALSRRLRMKQLMIPSSALSTQTADLDGDGTAEKIQLGSETVTITSPAGKSWSSKPFGNLGARGPRKARLRQVTTGDLNGDGLPELILNIDPPYTMTPTVVVFRNLGKLQFQRMVEGFIPGRGKENGIDRRVDSHRFTQAIDFAVKDFPLDGFVLGNLKNKTYGSVVAFPHFFHVDKRPSERGFEFYVDQRHLVLPDSMDSNIIEPIVQTVVAGPCGKDKLPVVAAVAEGKLWIYGITQLMDNGLIDKQVFDPPALDGSVGALMLTPDGVLQVKVGETTHQFGIENKTLQQYP